MAIAYGPLTHHAGLRQQTANVLRSRGPTIATIEIYTGRNYVRCRPKRLPTRHSLLLREIRDNVCTILGVRHGKEHLHAGDQRLRVGQPAIEVRGIPL